MFKDVQNSKDINTKFRSTYESRFTIDFEVNVCTTGHWPQAAPPKCIMPVELNQLTNTFKDYYLGTNSGRRLLWRMDQGQAEVKVRFSAEATYQLSVSSFQMMVLLLFNHQDVVTYHEMAELTSIPIEALEVQVKSLAHPKVKILLKNPPTSVFEAGHTFRINDKYTSKMMKIKIPVMKTVVQAKQEETERDNEIETQRRHQYFFNLRNFLCRIDAATVRIMKARKSMSNQQLVSEIVTQLSSRFQPKVSLIKQRIEHLIEQEYIERDSKDRYLFHFVCFTYSKNCFQLFSLTV